MVRTHSCLMHALSTPKCAAASYSAISKSCTQPRFLYLFYLFCPCFTSCSGILFINNDGDYSIIMRKSSCGKRKLTTIRKLLKDLPMYDRRGSQPALDSNSLRSHFCWINTLRLRATQLSPRSPVNSCELK